jgi:hypothetical protein
MSEIFDWHLSRITPPPGEGLMLRVAWLALAMAVASGLWWFGAGGGPDFAPFQFAAFLFGVLFLILLILGSPTLRSLI